MKYFFALTAILLSTLLFSCKKEDTPDGPQTPLASTFTATVDGQAWTPETFSAEYRDGRLLLVAEGSDGRRLALSTSISAAGVQEFSAANAPGVIFDKGTGVPPYLARYSTGQTGTLTISTLNLPDSLVSGEFSCKTRQAQTLNDDIALTNVRFENLKLTGLLPSVQKAAATVPASVGFSGFFTVAYISPLSGAIEISHIGTDVNSQVVLTMSKTINIGNYAFNSYLGGGIPAAAFSNSSTNFFDGFGGSLKVTSHDKTARTIAGTFSFTGTGVTSGGTVQVSNGSFSVAY